MEQFERETLEQELRQLRIKREIDHGSRFEHKRYAQELIEALWASWKSLMKEADDILVHSLRPTALRIKEIEEVLSITPEKRTKVESVLSMGP